MTANPDTTKFVEGWPTTQELAGFKGPLGTD